MSFFSSLYFIRGSLESSQFQITTRFCLVYGRNSNASVMANPQMVSYDGALSGNILVLGSSGSGKRSLVQEIVTNSMFGMLEGV